MLHWALIFFIISAVAGILGFSGIALVSSAIAKIFFVIFFFIFVLLLFGTGLRRR